MMANRFGKLAIAMGMGGLMTASLVPGAIAQDFEPEPYTTFLGSGESEIYEGYLLAGEAVYASCDFDCSDLDIYLYDAQTGELMEADTLLDSEPIVVAPYDGDFIIETVMVTCSTSICEAWTNSDEGF
mgnify:FL=1